VRKIDPAGLGHPADCGEQASPKRPRFLTELVENDPNKPGFWCVAKAYINLTFSKEDYYV